METEIKLCKDCKWLLTATGECGHESALIMDYINGNRQRHHAQLHRANCNINRDRHCGPEAAHFEPKETNQ